MKSAPKLALTALVLALFFLGCFAGMFSRKPSIKSISIDLNFPAGPKQRYSGQQIVPQLLARVSNSVGPKLKSTGSHSSATPSECTGCKIAIGALKLSLRTHVPDDTIVNTITFFCKIFNVFKPDVCDGFINVFHEQVLYALRYTYLEPNEICGILMGEQCHVVNSPMFKWSVPIPPSPKPPVTPVPAPKAGSPVLKVLQLTDIHYDEHYKEGASTQCKAMLCCQLSDGPGKTKSTSAGKFGDYHNCDTPLSTLQSMLAHIVANHKIDYIMWTGDVPPHDIWKSTREENLRVVEIVATMLKNTFPDIPIYPSVGNHETVPVNRGGFYTVSVQKGLRIISMNSNYCNSLNWWLLLNSTDPAQQLEWLIEELEKAELAGDKVHIISHIPPGKFDCIRIWSKNFNRIINRFESTVMAQFYGHTHTDEFELFYDEETMTRATNIAYISPSVTTYLGVNPSYRIFTVDGDYPGSTRAILDHETYFLNITEANENPDQPPEWRKVYSAKELYGLDSLQPQDWRLLVNRFETNDTLFQDFYRLYQTQSGISKKSCTGGCKEDLICELRSAQSNDPSTCKRKQ